MLKIRVCVDRSLQILVASALITIIARGQTAQSRSFPIASQPVVGIVRADAAGPYEVRGEATFAVTLATADDVVIGTLSYLLPDEARAKIAELSGKTPKDIPATLTRQEVVAHFQEGAACPELRLDLGSMDLDTSGVPVLLPGFVLEVREADEEVIKLLCIWARQIGAGKPRVGVIRAINRLLTW